MPAETQAAPMGRARVQEERARTPRAETKYKSLARVEARGKAQVKELVKAQEEQARCAEAQAVGWVQAVQAEVQTRQRAAAVAESAWAQDEVRARAEALKRALALALALALELELELGPGWWTRPTMTIIGLEVRAGRWSEPPYAEVLGDLKIKDILDSFTPGFRLRLAQRLWCRPEHFWLIQIFVPVTRLPPELLQYILSNVINEANGPPLVLMRVCKHWHTTITGFWASLKLGTRTPRDAVARELERNQWLLDIVVDTEIDRGDVTQSEPAYEAIFAAFEATSRWRSLVVQTFPEHRTD